MAIRRHPANPILGPEDVPPSREDFEVIGIFNAGAVRFGGEVLLLARVAERPVRDDPALLRVPVFDPGGGGIGIRTFRRDDPDLDLSDPRIVVYGKEVLLSSISHLRLARSRDGVRFDVGPAPALEAASTLEAYGLEDPRITAIDGDLYVTYCSISRCGISTSLARTKDLEDFERLGVIFPPENRDVALFPERIGGRYAALHRPVPHHFGPPEIWLARSPDLLHWGGHARLLGLRPGSWDSGRMGGGAPPHRTEAGWLAIYHGVDDAGRYSLGAVLLDLDDPARVIGRSAEPLLAPSAPYETAGFVGNVTFTCGTVLEEDGTLRIYYGVADRAIALAEIAVGEVLASLAS